jgi:hypothetical protein
MELEQALHEFKDMFPMTSAEEQRILQILGRLWQPPDGVTDMAKTTGRVDPPPIRYTIPNAYV